MPEFNPFGKLFSVFTAKSDQSNAINEELKKINKKLGEIDQTLEHLPPLGGSSDEATIRQAHIKQCNETLSDLYRRLNTVHEQMQHLPDENKSAYEQVYSATHALLERINQSDAIQDYVLAQANTNNPFAENPIFGAKTVRNNFSDSSPNIDPPTEPPKLGK